MNLQINPFMDTLHRIEQIGPAGTDSTVAYNVDKRRKRTEDKMDTDPANDSEAVERSPLRLLSKD